MGTPDLGDEVIEDKGVTENLSDEEIIAIRRILDEEGKRQWLYALARRFSAWLFATAAALVAFRDDIHAMLSWIWGGGS